MYSIISTTYRNTSTTHHNVSLQARDKNTKKYSTFENNLNFRFKIKQKNIRVNKINYVNIERLVSNEEGRAK